MEKVRSWLSETASPQITACASPFNPVDNSSVPACRHLVANSVPGPHLLSVRVVGRGSSHVEEVSLPIQVVDSGTVINFDSVALLPPPNLEVAERVGKIDETLDAPSNPFAGARVETRRVSLGKVEANESILPDSGNVAVQSSNGADLELVYTPQELFANVHLKSGPGFDKRRAWLLAEVHFKASVEAKPSPISIDHQSLRSPSRRLIYSQPVAAGSRIEIKASGGDTQNVGLGTWVEVSGQEIRFITTADGLVAETRMITKAGG